MKTDADLTRIHRDRLATHQIDELLGVVKGALLDGVLNQAEAEGILRWMNENAACHDTWPAYVLYERLHAALADGHLSPDETADLYGLMLQIAAPSGAASIGATTTPTTLPLTPPPFDISYPGKTFCFTGVFDFGTRAECHQAVIERGGHPISGITKKLNYLIIGDIGSDFWIHSTFGTKIQKAAEYRTSGVPIVIASESTWRTTIE